MPLDHVSESVSTLAEGLATGFLGAEPAPAAVPGTGAGDLGTDLAAALQLRCAALLTACSAAPPGQRVTLGPHNLTAPRCGL
jgi:hypothetical protein